jgi:tRNA (guanine-N7-)-methyltransferase
MRKKKHGEERLLACSRVMVTKREVPIASSDTDFGRLAPLWLEIGCGKGGFAAETARRNPDVCMYAMEKVENVMVIAAEQAVRRESERPTDNLRLMVGDAGDLPLWFRPHSLDRIFLNFSDPWPKKGHAKRRLTNRRFLSLYRDALKTGGKVIFKTDNRPLFEYSLEELAEMGITPEIVTFDLHNSQYNEGNVMTEYEKNFSDLGMPIHMLTFSFPEVGE